MAAQASGPLLLAGAGKMGGALLAGWLAEGFDPRRIVVQDPGPPPPVGDLIARHGIRCEPVVEQLQEAPAVIVAAVKPQAMDAVMPGLVRLCGPKTLVLSIAAGKRLASFERQLRPGAAVVRAMPNTPAAIGRGITVCVGNEAGARHREVVDALLNAVGEVAWVDDEAMMDAVTAVSGSGPAYVFLLAEVLARAGELQGLPRDLAARIARVTVAGAGELLHRSQDSAEQLRVDVTSPGGTTAAALGVLMRHDRGLADLMEEAVTAATKRGRELAG